jgi:ferrous iron transport protein A
MGLHELAVGETGVVCALLTTGSMRRRFSDIGLVRGTAVECVGRSPGGDPSAYRIRGAVIAIRAEDAVGVRVRPAEAAV